MLCREDSCGRCDDEEEQRTCDVSHKQTSWYRCWIHGQMVMPCNGEWCSIKVTNFSYLPKRMIFMEHCWHGAASNLVGECRDVKLGFKGLFHDDLGPFYFVHILLNLMQCFIFRTMKHLPIRAVCL